MQIDRTGTFLVTEVDRALGKTGKQGLPKLSVTVQILHWFDGSANGGDGEWIDFSEYGMKTTAYFTLAFHGKDGLEATFSFDDIMRVYGWDGRDFQDLTEIAAPESFMIKVKDNDPDYAAKNPFVVDKIDTADADPRGGLKKLDAKGIQELQAQFGALLSKKGKAAPPASAKKALPKPPKAVPQPSENAATNKKVAKGAKEDKAAKSERIAKENARIEAENAAKEAKAKAVKAPPTPPTVSVTETEEVVESKTKQEAFEYVYDMQAKGVTDEQRTAAWNAAIQRVAGDVDQKTITGEQWYKIMHETLNDIGAV